MWEYGQAAYWDRRFSTESNFEWLADLEQFSQLLLPYLGSADVRILHLGCGTSRLSFALYERGFRNITNVDYSAVLVNRMRELHPEMEWICDDMRTLAKLDSEHFDVVVEKASIECLLVDEQSQWNLSEKACRELDDTFGSVYRVLKPDGYFISISFTQPHFRVPHLLRNLCWSCVVDRFGDFFHYYVYRLQKGAAPNVDNLKHYFPVARQLEVGSSHGDKLMDESVSPLEAFAYFVPDF